MSSQRVSVTSLLGWLFLSAAGCMGGESSGENSAAVFDSAGIRVVSHRAGWDTTSVPIERVWVYGHEPGEYMFTFVAQGALMEDGGAVVGDVASQEVVAIEAGAAGHEILARRGQGPEEVLRPRAVVGVEGKSVWVEDVGNGKLMQFQGRVLALTVSTVSIPEVSRGLMPQGVDAEGRLLMTTSSYGSDFEQPWLSGSMVTFDVESGGVDTVGSYPMARRTEDGGALNPFSAYGVVAAAGGDYVSARTDQPRVTWRTADGEITQIVQWEPVLAYPDESVWARFKASMREDLNRINPRLGGERLEEFVDQQIARYEMDETLPLPLFGSIHGSSTGDVWLAEFSPRATWPSAYQVVSSTGEWLGRVVFPGPVNLLDLRGDQVLCVLKDSLDVHGVALYHYSLGL
jgi:hypothetical protein